MKHVGSGIVGSHVTSDEPPHPALVPPHPGPHVDPMGSHIDPVAPPPLADAPPAMTNGNHALPPSANQPPSTRSGPGRPTSIGLHANAGPPKKRHKGWSPDSAAPTLVEHPLKTPPSSSSSNPSSSSSNPSSSSSAAALPSAHPAPALLNGSGQRLEALAPPTVPQGSLLSLPSHGASVTVPDHLLQTCRLQPVIFNGHGPLPQLCGNVGEVLVSSLLQTCYLSSQTLPRVYQHYGPSPIQPLSTEMQILLTVYYLVQLGPDQVPLVEDLEQIFMRSWRESHLSEIRQYQQPGPAHPDRLYGMETPPSMPGMPPLPSLPPHGQQSLSPSQLPWLAQLAASSCGEGVQVLGESGGSLAQGLTQTFSRLLEGQLASTNYVVIIVTAVGQETQSCVVVTGKHQCRAVAESLYSPSEGLREMDQQLSSGAAQDLAQYCSSLGPDSDMDSLLGSISLDSLQPSPLSSSQESLEKSPPGHQGKDAPSPKDTHTPSPKHLGTPSPKERGTPSPKDTGTPSPKDTGTPSPKDADTPSPKHIGTSSPKHLGDPSLKDTGTPNSIDTGTPSPKDSGTPSPKDRDTCSGSRGGGERKRRPWIWGPNEGAVATVGVSEHKSRGLGEPLEKRAALPIIFLDAL
ncbi:unnamed protein product [Arctogadus glacialis]